MTVFQRTPPWIMPRPDHEISARTRRLLRAVPLLQRLERARIYFQFEWMVVGFHHPPLMRLVERTARKHLEAQIADPELRSSLLPDYRLGCKRILLSDDYLPALAQPNVDVVTDAIREIGKHGVIDDVGVEHPVDVIIFGTGFNTLGLPLTDRLYDGDGVTMDEKWSAGGCQSWYLNRSGRNVNIWPGTTFDYRRRTLRFDPAAHVTHRATTAPTPVDAAAEQDTKAAAGVVAASRSGG